MTAIEMARLKIALAPGPASGAGEPSAGASRRFPRRAKS